MPGFRHPPGADIQRIRQDLRDRYHDGFPILKELLQNADDAGAAQAGHAATQCTFALCEDGLPGAQHALLCGPGLAVINDGGFTAEDANSLTSLGLSNKAGQSAAKAWSSSPKQKQNKQKQIPNCYPFFDPKNLIIPRDAQGWPANPFHASWHPPEHV